MLSDTKEAEPAPQPAASAANPLSQSCRLRIGVIGPGQIVDQWLIPALKTLDGAVLWSVLGRDAGRARSFADKHGAKSATPVYTDLDSFLCDPHLEAVIIATPDKLHAVQAIAAARAGKHVFLEKPMATNLAEAEQILQAVKSAAVKLAIGYHLRFHTGHQAVKEAIAAGSIGEIRHMRVCWTLKADTSDWRAASATGRWWSLGATGTHALDMVRWLMQPSCGKIVEASAIVSSSVYGGPHDETAVVSLRLQSGATAEVVSSVVFSAPRTIEIFGSKGSIVCKGTLGARGAGEITLNDQKLEFTPANPYARELQNFIDSIRGGKAPLVDGEEGAANIALLEQLVGAEPSAEVAAASAKDSTKSEDTK